MTNFYAESERINSDVDHRSPARGACRFPRAGCSACPRTARERRFSIRRSSRASARSSSRRGPSSKASSPGLHRSPFKGFSVEFAEYRQYIPGDDLSTDRLEGLRAQRSPLRQEVRGGNQPRLPPAARRQRLDGLRLAPRPDQSSRCGACLAASLGYLMNRQRDAVGLTGVRREHRRDAAGQLAARASAQLLLVTLDRLTDRRTRPTSRSRCISSPTR